MSEDSIMVWYGMENTNADFDSDLVVEGVVLELQSLSSLLKIF